MKIFKENFTINTPIQYLVCKRFNYKCKRQHPRASSSGNDWGLCLSVGLAGDPKNSIKKSLDKAAALLYNYNINEREMMFMSTTIREQLTVSELEALEGLREWLELEELPTALDLREWMWRGDG